MLSDWSSTLTPQRLASVFGAAQVDDGRALVIRGAVVSVEWDPRMITAQGLCQISDTEVRSVTVSFTSVGIHWRIARTRCGCRARRGCSHAVALLLAMNPEFRGGTAVGGTEPAWERALAPLLEPVTTVPESALALGLSVRCGLGPDGITLPVAVRLVQRGISGNWSQARLSWSDLRHHDMSDTYNLAHRSAVAAVGDAVPGSRPRGRWLELDDCSPTVWPALRAAITAGVEMVPETVESLSLADNATMAVEVSAAGDEMSVHPVLTVDGAEPDHARVRFVGAAPPHGVAVVAAAHVALAPLRPPPGDALVAMYGRGESVSVPADDVIRFRTEILPRIAVTTPVHLDGRPMASPAVRGPWLVIRIRPTEGRFGVGWVFRYEVDGVGVDYPADADAVDSPIRDAAAETTVVTARRSTIEDVIALSSSWPAQAIARCQLRLRRGDPAARLDAEALRRAATPRDAARAATITAITDPIRFTESEAARFTIELLPLLRADDDVLVEIDGELPAYRLAQSDPVIRMSAAPDSTSPQAHRLDWLDLQLSVEVEGRTVAVGEVLEQLSAGATHMLDDSGLYFALDTPEIRRLGELLAEAETLDDIGSAALTASRRAGLDDLRTVTWWDELFELGVPDRQISRWRDAVSAAVSTALMPKKYPRPHGITAYLRPYQLDGVNWLRFLYENSLGGILADDMGLGKTLQTLGLIVATRDDTDKPFLVVAPTSVLGNWGAEATAFAPSLRLHIVVTTQAKHPGPLASRIADIDVVVTSYALLRIDIGQYADIDWAGVVFDEAQFVKNPQSKVYSCARQLSARSKIAITGTPLENNLTELWSLLSITAPGILPSLKHFGDYFRKPIESGTDTARLATLRRRIRPVILRRRKSDVIDDLPEKTELVLTVDLSARHRRIYDARATREKQKVVGLLGDWERNKFAIFRSLTMLRQLSLHAGLVEDRHRSVSSAKIDFVAERLVELADEGHRALVFSQFTGFLDLLRRRLDAIPVDYSYLDGTLSQSRRQREIAAFSSGERSAFLISLKAGGFGLNLATADYCFVCDPWWNPATEQQAIDRLHRIGQRRAVTVYRLVSAGTVEDKVIALQERKRALFDAVLDDGNVFSDALTADDVAELLA